MVQGNEYFAPALSLANGTFNLSYVSSYLFRGEIDGSAFKANKDSVMMNDTEVITLTVNYKDFDGDTGTFTREVPLMKVRAGKDATLYFAWSKSETEFVPKDSSFFMWGSAFSFFNGGMMGTLPLLQWSTNREEIEELRDSEYCYLWAKLTESGVPFLFTGKQGIKGLTGACTLYQYYASTSSTEQTGGEWLDEMPSIAGGKFLWMRTKFVPAGGNADDYEWGTPVVAGSDISLLMASIKEIGDEVEQNTASITGNAGQIETKVSRVEFDSLGGRVTTAETAIEQNATDIELRATKNELESEIKQTAEKIALYVDGSDVKNSAGVIVGVVDDEGYVKITASNILLDGSVTASSLSSECFSGKIFLVTEGGEIRGGNIADDGTFTGTGFRIGADGKLLANDGTFYNCSAVNFTITGGKFDSESLETVKAEEETTRTISSKVFPTESSKWYYDRSLIRPSLENKIEEVGEVDLQSNCNVLLGGKTYTKSSKYNLWSGAGEGNSEFSEEQSCTRVLSKTYTRTFKNQVICLGISGGGTLQGYYSWDDYYTTEDVYVSPTYGWVITDQTTSSIDPGGGGTVPSNPSVGDSYYIVIEKNGKFLLITYTYQKTANGYWTTKQKWNAGGSRWETLSLSYKRVYVNGVEKSIGSWLYIGDGEQTVTLKYEVEYTGNHNSDYTQYQWKSGGTNHTFYCKKSYKQYYRYKYNGTLGFTSSDTYITLLSTGDGELLFVQNLPSGTSYVQEDVSITIDGTKYLEAGTSYTTWTGADKYALPENGAGGTASGNVSSGTFLGATLSTSDILIINGSSASVIGEHSLSISGNTYVKESEWDSKTAFSVTLMTKIKGVHATDIYRKDGGYGRIGDAGNPFTAVYTEFLGNCFPVGSVYMSTRNISPASFLGGEWTPFAGGAGFWTQDVPTDSSGNYNYDGSSNFNGVTESEALPNLEGEFGTGNSQGYILNITKGAFYPVTQVTSYPAGTGSGQYGYYKQIGFSASRYNSSLYGDYNPVRPKSYKVYAWRRVN